MKKVISLFIVTLILASCSANNDQNNAEGEEEVTEITFMRTGTPDKIRDIFEPIIEDFEEENPDIKVDLKDFGWDEAEKEVQTMGSSQSFPDVMYHLPGTIFDLADKGMIRDLNGYLDEDSELKDDITPALLEAGQYDNKQYIIPSGATTLLLWYNADLFEEAGLDPDSPPETWEDTLSAAKKIDEETDASGIAMYGSPGGGETSFLFESLFASEIGENTWDPEEQTYLYDKAEYKDSAVETLDFIDDLTEYAQSNIEEYDRFEVRPLLRDDKSGMVLETVNMVNEVSDEVDDETIRAAQIPAGASGDQISAVNMGGWFIPENSEHPDEAWKFIKFLMETENQIKHSTYGSVPILNSEAEELEGEYGDVISKSVQESVPEGVSPNTDILWDETGDELQKLMMSDDQTPQKTLENINQKHKEIYDK